jgi:mono/diheme cytochrome c family protein
MTVALGPVLLAASISMDLGIATAQESGSISEGRKLAQEVCSECHKVDESGPSRNPEAPAFEDIANVPGMTSTALTVALQTSHSSMPNLVIKGRDAQNIIAYVLSLKKRN